MKIYLAGEGHLPWLEDNFFDFYRLESFIYGVKRAKDFHRYKGLILDSGIFTYLSGKPTENVDWIEYCDRYAAFVKKHKIKHYVEIDLDTFIGLDQVEKLRNRLEKKVGWQCMPVWHMNRGWDKWLEICDSHPYVCFGAFITDGLKQSKYKAIHKFIEAAKERDCMVHGLGFTNMEGLKKYKFDSVDSSSWTSPVRYNQGVHYFDENRIKLLKKPVGSRMTDRFKLTKFVFYEWIKFSNYAEQNL